MTDKVVFLDIDGVLNDEAHRASVRRDKVIVAWSEEIGRAMIDPARAARLQRLCDEGEAAVVIVSGWRRWASAEAIASALAAAGLRSPVLGVVAGLKMSGDLRATGAKEWLAEHPEVRRFVVLDNTRRYWEGWGAFGEALVAPADGLTDADVDAALAILRRPEAAAPEKAEAAAPAMGDIDAIRVMAVALDLAGEGDSVTVRAERYRGHGERSDRRGWVRVTLLVGGGVRRLSFVGDGPIGGIGATEGDAVRAVRKSLVYGLAYRARESRGASKYTRERAEKLLREADDLDAKFRDLANVIVACGGEEP